MDMIAAGDSHSVACNSHYGIIYFWGSYRSEVRGIRYFYIYINLYFHSINLKGRFYGPIIAPLRI